MLIINKQINTEYIHKNCCTYKIKHIFLSCKNADFSDTGPQN